MMHISFTLSGTDQNQNFYNGQIICSNNMDHIIWSIRYVDWSDFKAGAFLAKMKLKYLAGIRFFYYLNIFWWSQYSLMLLIYSPKKFQFVIFQMKVDFSKIDWIIRHRFYTIKDSRDHLNLIFIWIKQDQFKL